MINDCLKLATPGIRLVRIAVEEGGRGYILGHSRGRWVVWRVFRVKGSKRWSMANGSAFSTRLEAEADFKERLEKNFIGER